MSLEVLEAMGEDSSAGFSSEFVPWKGRGVE